MDGSSTAESYELLKVELRKRDETIARQRKDLLSLQDAYDSMASCLHPSQSAETNGASNLTIAKLETDIVAYRQTIRDQELTIQRLHETMEQMEESSRHNGGMAQESVEQHEAYIRLRNQLREAEERLAEANGSGAQRVELLRQLKQDLARSNESLQAQQARILQLEGDAVVAAQRLTELATEKELLRNRLHEDDLRINQGRNELQARVTELMEQLERERAELVDARDRYARLERDAAQAGSLLEAKTRDCTRLQHEAAVQQRRLVELEAELARTSDSEGVLQQEMVRNRTRTEQAESELSSLKRQLKAATDETARAELRIRELDTDSRRERENLNQEISKRDSEVQRLKSDLLRTQEGTVRSLEQRVAELERSLQTRASESATMQLDLDARAEKCRLLDAHASELKIRLSDETNEKNRLRSKLQELEMELDALHHNVETKESLIQQVREDNEGLERQQEELSQKLSHRNDLLQRLSGETAKLKARFEEKLLESQHQSETIRKLQDTLVSTEAAYEQLRLKHDENLITRDSAIKELQNVLNDLQAQSNRCIDKLAHAETDNARLAEANKQLTATVDDTREQLAHFDQANHKLQLELCVAQEKHRSALKEVTTRDQAVLRLQSEVDELHRKHEAAMDEISLKDRELNRHQQRQRELAAEMRTLNSSIEAYDKKLLELERFAHEKETSLDLARQEHVAVCKLVEQVKTELHREKQAHEEDSFALKEEVNRLQRELEDAGITIADLKGESSKNRLIIDSLQTELSKARQTAEHLTNQSENQELVMKQHEMAIEEKKRELESLASRKDEEVRAAESSASTFRQKYEQCLGHIEELRVTLELLQKQLLDTRQRDFEKQDQLQKLRIELDTTSLQFDELKKANLKFERLTAELTRELQSATSDCEIQADRVRTCEQQLESMSRKVEMLSGELSQKDADCARLTELQRNARDESMRKDQRINELENELDESQRILAQRARQVSQLEATIGDLKQEVASAREQRCALQSEFASLTQRLEQVQFDVAGRDSRNKADLAKAEERLRRLEAELNDRSAEIARLETELTRKASELRAVEEQAANLRQEVASLRQRIESEEAKIREFSSSNSVLEVDKRALETEVARRDKMIESIRSELQDRAMQQRNEAQRVAQLEERLAASERQLAASHSDQTQRAQDIGRLEQTNRKITLELKTTRDCNEAFKQELQEQKDSFDRMRKELQAAKEGEHRLQQEALTFKQQAQKCELELTTIRERERLLNEQAEQQEALATQLQKELKAERTKHAESARLLQQAKQTLTDYEREIESREQLINQTQAKLRESIAEMEQTQTKLAQSRQQLAETDSQLRALQTNGAALERKCALQSAEIERYDESLAALQRQLASRSEESNRVSSQLAESERRVGEQRVQLQALQSAHQEALDSVQALRADLLRMQQHSQSLFDESAMSEQKANEMRQAQRNAEAECARLRDELSSSNTLNTQLQTELSSNSVKCKQLMQQLAEREQELKLLRIDLSAVREKGEMKDVDVQAALRELDRLRQQVIMFEQVNADLRHKLEEANETNARLQQESEYVIRNVHKWVEEQKLANEKLTVKIRDQSKALAILQDDRDRLAERVESLGDDTRRSRGNSGNLDVEKLRALQQHSAAQQQLITQLQARLKEYETREAGFLQKDGRESFERRMSETVLGDVQNAATDKLYWMQRAAELSVELQRNNKFWNDQTRLNSQSAADSRDRRSMSAAPTPVPMALYQSGSGSRLAVGHTSSPTHDVHLAGANTAATIGGRPMLTPTHNLASRLGERELDESSLGNRPDSGYQHSLSTNS